MSKAVDMFGIKQKIKENRQNIIINGVEDDEATAMLLDAINQTKEDILDVVLTKTNTTAYTPKTQYNPVTKKYVDSAVDSARYSLPIASTDSLGGVMIGENLSIDENGMLNATGGSAQGIVHVKENTFNVYNAEPGFYIFDQDTQVYYTGNGSSSYTERWLSGTTVLVGGLGGNPAHKISYALATSTGRNALAKMLKSFYSEAYFTNLWVDDVRTIVATFATTLAKDNTTAYTPTGPYHPATKKYVDDKVSTFTPTIPIASNTTLGGIKVGDGLNIDADGILSALGGSSNAGIEVLSGAFTYQEPLDLQTIPEGVYKVNIIDSTYGYFKYGNNEYSSELHSGDIFIVGPIGDAGGTVGSRVFVKTGIYNYVNGFGSFIFGLATASNSSGTPQLMKLNISASNPIIYKSDVLTKTNSVAFTPTSDYNPATKKYVDTAVSNIDLSSTVQSNTVSSISVVTSLPAEEEPGVLYLVVEDTPTTETT